MRLLLLAVTLFSALSSGLAQFSYTGGPIDTNGACRVIWAEGDTAFIGFKDKLLRTFDGGENWEHLTNGIPYAPDPRTITYSDGNLMVGTNDDSRVYMSQDWGDSFDDGANTLSPLLIPTHAIGAEGIQMIAGTLDAPHTYDATTQSWEEAEAGGSTTHGLSYLGDGEIWQCAGNVSGGVTRYSEDNGQTWNLPPSEPQIDIGGGLMWNVVPQAFLRVQNRILIGSALVGFPVVYSDDNGMTWNNSDLPSTSYSDYGARFVKISDDHLLTTNLDGIWKSTDQGATWTLIQSISEVLSFSLFKDDHLLVATENGLCEFADYGEGGIVAKHGGAGDVAELMDYDGALWAAIGGQVSAFNFQNQVWQTIATQDADGNTFGDQYIGMIGDSIFICGNGLQVAHQDELVFNFTGTSGFGFQDPSYITMVDGRKIVGSRSYNWTQAPRMWYSDDNGTTYTEATWTNNVAFGFGAVIDNHIEEIFVNGTTLLADMNAGYALSNDNGSSWTYYGDSYANTQMTYANGVFYQYLVTGLWQDQFSFQQSTNGIDWTPMTTTGLPSADAYQGIWFTNNQLFTKNGTAEPYGIYALNAQNEWELSADTDGLEAIPLNRLYATTDGLYGLFKDEGLWRSSDAVVSIPTTENAIDFNLYPNPAKSFVNIEGVPTGANITIRNIQGEIVLQPRSTRNIDLSRLHSGMYFISVSEQSVKYTKELIILN